MNAVAMQTSVQRTAFAGKAVQSAARPARVCRAVVQTRAEGAESRRAVLGGLLAGVAALTVPRANAVDIRDDTKVRERGFDLIYEARDLDLAQGERDGMTQFRGSVAETKKRVEEAESRVDGKLGGFIAKKYWTLAREELRLQVGTLRFDFATLAQQLNKAQRKEALKLNDAFYAKVDVLDFAMRKKDAEKANAAYAEVKSSLDAVLAALG